MHEKFREDLHRELDILLDTAIKNGHVGTIMDLMLVNTICSENEDSRQRTYSSEFCEEADGSMSLEERVVKIERWYREPNDDLVTVPAIFLEIDDDGMMKEVTR